MAKQEVHIKVLAVVDSINNGGAGRAAYRILQGVNSVCHDLSCRVFVKDYSSADSVVTLKQLQPKGRLFAFADWILTKINNKLQHARWFPYRQTQDNAYKSDLRGSCLFGAFKKLDYDVLHLHWINKRFIRIFDLPKDKPIVWTLHDTWPFCGVCHYFGDCDGYTKQCGSCPSLGSQKDEDLSRIVWQKKKTVYSGLNLHVVAPSRWMANCAKHSSLFHDVDIRVIPNCIDTNEFAPLSVKQDKKFILYGAVNAAVDERKGFKYLLSALQSIQNQIKDAELLVFGASESDIDITVNVPVHYLGFISDTKQLVELYNKASVMVVPSLNENLSCAIMEALSCATPVCCFNIGGNGDMVEHQVNGYLAKEKDAEDLGRGILWCLENNSDNHLGKAARESVIQKYSISVVAKQYVELYEEII